MSDRNDSGRAEALAHDALAWMAQRHVPPTAQNFEVILAYVSGENPDLKSTIDGLASRDCKFDPSVMTSLHDQYFRIRRESEELTELSGKISSELGSLVKMLNTAGRDQSAYGYCPFQGIGRTRSSRSLGGPDQEPDQPCRAGDARHGNAIQDAGDGSQGVIP